MKITRGKIQWVSWVTEHSPPEIKLSFDLLCNMRVSVVMKNDLPARLPWMFSFNHPTKFDQYVEVGVLIDILGFWEKFHEQSAFVIAENARYHLAHWWTNLEFLSSLFNSFHCRGAGIVSGIQ